MAAEMDTLQQAHKHPYIRQHRRRPQSRLAQNHVFQSQFDIRRQFAPFLVRLLFAGRGRLFMDCRRRFSLSHLDVAGATGVKSLLQPFAARSLVVSGTSLVGTLSAMVLSAAEGATQIDPAGAARMRQKAEPAISAEGHATLQPRMGS